MPIIDQSYTILILWAVLGYLFGSVPFGIIITRALGLGNLREIGSGNIGTTNVLRTGNKKAAFATLLLDGAKGAVVALLAWWLVGKGVAQLAGLMALIGHCYPVWLGFRGGKGVATFLGLLLVLAWPVGIASCLSWLLVAWGTRTSSMSALMAAALSTMWIMLLGYPDLFLLGVVLTLLIFWRHRENVTRLRAGTEPKIGQT